MTFGFMTWTHVGLGTGFVPNPIEAVAPPGGDRRRLAAAAEADGWAFAAAAVGIAGTVGSIFAELYPRVMVSTTNAAYNLTVNNTASPPYTLKVMTVVAAVFFPVVLLYQAGATTSSASGSRSRRSEGRVATAPATRDTDPRSSCARQAPRG